MTKTHKASLPVVLLLSALALSACATKPKEEKPAAPPAAAVEQPAAPAAAEQPAPTPPVVAETPAPKKVAKKHKRKAKPAPVKAPEPEPVAAPAPAPAPAPVVAPAPAPIPVVQAPAPAVAEKGFLESYWMWLVALIVAAAGIIFAVSKKKE